MTNQFRHILTKNLDFNLRHILFNNFCLSVHYDRTVPFIQDRLNDHLLAPNLGNSLDNNLFWLGNNEIQFLADMALHYFLVWFETLEACTSG